MLVIRGIPMMVLIFFIAFVGVPWMISFFQVLASWTASLGAAGLSEKLASINAQSISMDMRAQSSRYRLLMARFWLKFFARAFNQLAAARWSFCPCSGHVYWQTMRFIILPQAIRNVLPALGNDFVSMLKDSSLVSVLAVRDITQIAKLYNGRSFHYQEAYIVLAMLYLSMTVILSFLVKLLEEVSKKWTLLTRWSRRLICGKSFGKLNALDGVNVSVKKGQVIVIIGPSGSNQINIFTLSEPARNPNQRWSLGWWLQNYRNPKILNEVRSEIGMVFQHFNLYPHLSVLDNVTLAQRIVKKVPRAEAEEIAIKHLKRVGIGEKVHAFPGQLSGGQQQQVAIARALAQKPKNYAVWRTNLCAWSRNDQRSIGSDVGFSARGDYNGCRYARNGICRKRLLTKSFSWIMERLSKKPPQQISSLRLLMNARNYSCLRSWAIDFAFKLTIKVTVYEDSGKDPVSAPRMARTDWFCERTTTVCAA